jgi:acyl carrier protein
MGLDILDVMFRVEREFDICLSEKDLEGLARDQDIQVGDLYDIILKKMHLRDVGRYSVQLNNTIWLEVRRVLFSITAVPLEAIELKTPLKELFPRTGRRAAWNALRDACPYQIPDLGYPPIVRAAAFSLAITMAFVEQFQIWQVPALKWLWPILGMFGIWMLAETYLKVLAILRPFRNSLPVRMTTVKDLCRAVLAANYEQACRKAGISFDKRSVAVWQQLTAILADSLGVEADEVTFRSRLYRDLGAT